MSIQNYLLFSLICITHYNTHTMEQSFTTNQNSFTTVQEYNIWLTYINTDEYKAFMIAEENYKKNKTPETFARMKQAATELLKKKETEKFARMTMEKTPVYKQYQQAKVRHEEENTADTLSILKFCETELHSSDEYERWLKTQQNPAQSVTKVQNNNPDMFSNIVLENYRILQKTGLYQEYNTTKKFPGMFADDSIHDCLGMIGRTEEFIALLRSMHQEKNAMNNLIQSEKWVSEQEYAGFPKYAGFPWIKSMMNRATKESKDLQAKLIDFLFNKLETQLLLDAIYITTITHPRTNRAISNCFIQPKGKIINIPLKSSNNNNNNNNKSCTKEIKTKFSLKF